MIAVAVAAALVLATAVVGFQLLNRSATSSSQLDSSDNVVDPLEILTSPATPFIEVDVGNIAEVVPIASARSFDPRGGAPNGVLGKEREKGAPLAIDGDAVTAWTTKAYKSSTLGKKGGVGLILDLGQEVDVTGVSLGLVGYGTDLQIRVANEILPDPDLWTRLVSIEDAGPQIDLRAPRAVTGRYVLIWLTGIPPKETGDRFQAGIASASVFGATVSES